eukprot:11847367-Karenia_brevis.AAC.1
MPEVKHRCGMMMSVFQAVRKRFLCQPGVPNEKKSQVISSLLLSRSLVNAGVWPKLNKSEFSKFHSSVMGVYRAAFSDVYFEGYESDAALLARVELLAPYNLLRMMRLMLLSRVCVKGTLALWAALVAAKPSKKSWRGTVWLDLQ